MNSVWSGTGNQRSVAVLPHDFEALLHLPANVPSRVRSGIPISMRLRPGCVYRARAHTRPRLMTQLVVYRVLLVLSHEYRSRHLVAQWLITPIHPSTNKMSLDDFTLLRGGVVVVELNLVRR